MLNPDKIRWMSRASIYEKRKGRKDLKMNEYFLSDYVRFTVLENAVGVTLAYVLLLGILALCNIEMILQMTANLRFGLLLREVILFYAIIMVIYAGIGVIFYAWQYQSGKNRIRKYYRMLKLIEKYEQEDE